MKANSLFVILAFLIIMPMISASGLIISPNSFYINKTAGISQSISFNITNADTKIFNNITFVGDYLSIPTINSIQSGQTLTVNGYVITNQDINASVRVKGYYLTNTGQQNKVYNVSIFLNSSVNKLQSNPCDFTILKGDTVNFLNKNNNQITIKDVESNWNTNIPANGQFSNIFNTPSSLKYSVWILSMPFSDVCIITALDTQGYVNDPSLDAFINLNVKNTFAPTNISISMLNSNFTTDFFGTQQGIMTITNTGSNIAYNVKLAGDWLSFSPNNFNLNTGESKGIIYTITPLITQTLETNRTHIKVFNITGNFPTTSNSVSVFVNYANLNTNSTSKEDIDYLNRVFCPQYPNSVLCNGTGQNIVYKYINNQTDNLFNVTMSEQQVRDLWLYVFSLGDKIETSNNFVKEQINSIQNLQNSTSLDTASLAMLTKENQEKQENATKNVVILVIIFLLLISITIIGVLIYLKRKQAQLDFVRRF